MAIPAIHRFSFQAQELIQKLRQTSRLMLTGYWHCEFSASDPTGEARSWYLGLSQGRVIFSGTRQISWAELMQVLQRYIPHLRSEEATQNLARLGQWFADHYASKLSFPHALNELYKLGLITPPQVERALRLKILADCDTYLFENSGHAEFLPLSQLHSQSPIAGLGIEEVLSEAMERQAWWSRLRTQIPSMHSMPVLNRHAVTGSNLTLEQKQRLETLVSSGKTLDNIAYVSAQDDLEIAKVFAKLINQGVISLRAAHVAEPETTSVMPQVMPETVKATPEIVVVDDSAVLLKQFESLVAGWGYVVKCFSNPTDALQALPESQPTLIFLDINMPDVTGFDLVKQIRRFPDLDSVPLVMLTAERTLSNNWRARWSGCKFLTKPLTPDEVPQFQMELRMLLAELAPLQSFNPMKTYPGYQATNY